MVLGLNCVRVRQEMKSDLFPIDNDENISRILKILSMLYAV